MNKISSTRNKQDVQRDRAQALRDYKLMIEYKHLKHNAPGGVYVLPSFEDLRIWYGVIFVRRGHYINGIFKFYVKIPPEYNGQNTWPEIWFTSDVFNPLIDPVTGAVDVKYQFPTWDPSRHYMVTVLTFLKKVFYIKEFRSYRGPFNPEAHRLYETDKAAFLHRVDECVQRSEEMVYEDPPLERLSNIRKIPDGTESEGADNDGQPKVSFMFHEPKSAYSLLSSIILGSSSEGKRVVKTSRDIVRVVRHIDQGKIKGKSSSSSSSSSSSKSPFSSSSATAASGSRTNTDRRTGTDGKISGGTLAEGGGDRGSGGRHSNSSSSGGADSSSSSGSNTTTPVHLSGTVKHAGNYTPSPSPSPMMATTRASKPLRKMLSSPVRPSTNGTATTGDSTSAAANQEPNDGEEEEEGGGDRG